jgi:hypothetical protein
MVLSPDVFRSIAELLRIEQPGSQLHFLPYAWEGVWPCGNGSIPCYSDRKGERPGPVRFGIWV